MGSECRWIGMPRVSDGQGNGRSQWAGGAPRQAARGARQSVTEHASASYLLSEKLSPLSSRRVS